MKKEELNDLVIGRKYKVKSKEWFEKNNIDDFHYRKAVAYDYTDKKMVLWEIVNGDTLVLGNSWKYNDGYVWLKRDAVDEIHNQKKPSKEIINAIKKLKKEKYIYGYDGGPGGGSGGTINTEEEHILPVFEEDGSEAIYLNVSSCKRTFTLEKIKELFKTGKTEQSFRATEWTTIRTELKLIKDKTKLPERSSWETMRD